MNWSSNAVYEGKLIADTTVENHNINDDFSVLLFMNTAHCNMGESCESDNVVKINFIIIFIYYLYI